MTSYQVIEIKKCPSCIYYTMRCMNIMAKVISKNLQDHLQFLSCKNTENLDHFVCIQFPSILSNDPRFVHVSFCLFQKHVMYDKDRFILIQHLLFHGSFTRIEGESMHTLLREHTMDWSKFTINQQCASFLVSS